MRIVVALIAGLLAGGLLAAAGFATPSFDCARATARDEQTICADPGLAQLDDVMAAALTEVQGLRGAALRPYELMLLENRQACGGRADCIAEAQRYAIEVYGALGAKGAGAPGQFFRHTGMPSVLRAWHRADGECRGRRCRRRSRRRAACATRYWSRFSSRPVFAKAASGCPGPRQRG